MNNDDELKALYKIMEHDGKITVNEINTITKKIEEANKTQLEGNKTSNISKAEKNLDSDGTNQYSSFSKVSKYGVI